MAFLSLFLWQAEGEDSLKKMQLMELAILNGTYRDANVKSRKDNISSAHPPRHSKAVPACNGETITLTPHPDNPF